MLHSHVTDMAARVTKVGIPNFISGPREYIMEGEYVITSEAEGRASFR